MQEIEIVKKAIKEAGKKVMEFYNKPKIEYKKDKSPVTEADLTSNKVLIDILKKTGYPILSEETEDNLERLKSEKVWIIDPLDGTQDFIQKTGEFSVMVGLVENGKPILGVVYQPADRKLFFAEKNKGAFVEVGDNKVQKLKVGQIVDPKKSRMVVSRNHLSPEDEKISRNLEVAELKKSGSNGVKIGKIASNEADFFVNSWTGMGEWDLCGPEIILIEAGGKMTDVEGKELQYNKKNSKMTRGVAASNGKFHQKIIESIKNSK